GDLEAVAPQVGFDYRSARGGPSWLRLSPAGKRRVIARAQSRAKGGKFI
ncbi:MAG: MFS transporter, partial [Deltaproteobacteria bacterium]|nr:MFS transporter [Deltaproteobacteria bacterium]